MLRFYLSQGCALSENLYYQITKFWCEKGTIVTDLFLLEDRNHEINCRSGDLHIDGFFAIR